MQETAVKSKSTAIMVAVLIAIAAAAIGISASAAPAYAAVYTPGTYADNAKTIPPAKSKIAGTWKLVKSTKASDNQIIKRNRKISSKAKYTMTFNKNGKIVMKDYDGSKITKYKWIATAKKAGFLTYLGIMVSPIKVKGKTLKITFPKTASTKGFTWTMKKI